MTLNADQIAELAVDMAHFSHALEVAPLSAVKAWHNPNGTSQRAVLQALQDYKTVIAAGGNQSGKTFLLRGAVVALVLGSDHPHARMFWVNNGCDPDRFPKGPGKAYIVALSSNDSKIYHREQIAALLPFGGDAPYCRWLNRNSVGPAEVKIDVPGYNEPAIIYFKSEDQGAEKFQGAQLRAVLHDEEGKTAEVWEECVVRLIAQSGWQMMANTPLNGRTWVWKKFVHQTPPDVAYREIWTEDNPFLPGDAVEKLKRGAKAAARTRGAWEVAEGLVYGGTDELEGWSRGRHVLTRQQWADRYPDLPFGEFPADWPRFRSQDFGMNNPGCAQWYVLDPEDRIVLYRQIYRPGWGTIEWARAIIQAEGGDTSSELGREWRSGSERVLLAWADPAAKEQITSLNRHYGVRYRKANNDWEHGRSVCYSVLQSLPDGTPGFSVLDGAAPDFVAEIEGYRYPDRTPSHKNEDERPIKKDDHAMDAWRYAMVGIRRWAR